MGSVYASTPWRARDDHRLLPGG
uniref:Uncharacterized protein n=1 Tax=Arundo donax TaxID=35708 RepID=A0A0A9BSG4_ARUDO